MATRSSRGFVSPHCTAASLALGFVGTCPHPTCLLPKHSPHLLNVAISHKFHLVRDCAFSLGDFALRLHLLLGPKSARPPHVHTNLDHSASTPLSQHGPLPPPQSTGLCLQQRLRLQLLPTRNTSGGALPGPIRFPLLRIKIEPWQWIEHLPANQRIAGSIRSQGTCLGCGPGPQ